MAERTDRRVARLTKAPNPRAPLLVQSGYFDSPGSFKAFLPGEVHLDVRRLAVPHLADPCDRLVNRDGAAFDTAACEQKNHDLIARINEPLGIEAVLVEVLGPLRGQPPEPRVTFVEMIF